MFTVRNVKTDSLAASGVDPAALSSFHLGLAAGIRARLHSGASKDARKWPGASCTGCSGSGPGPYTPDFVGPPHCPDEETVEVFYESCTDTTTGRHGQMRCHRTVTENYVPVWAPFGGGLYHFACDSIGLTFGPAICDECYTGGYEPPPEPVPV